MANLMTNQAVSSLGQHSALADCATMSSHQFGQVQVATPPSRAGSIIARLAGANKHLAELCNQAESVADKIVGSAPNAPCAGTTGTQIGGGLLSEVDVLGEQIHALLSRLQSALSRIDNAL